MIKNKVVIKDIKENFKEEIKFICSCSMGESVDEIWEDSGLARLMMYFLYNEVVGTDARIDCDVSFEVLINQISNDNVLLNGAKAVLVERQVRAGTKMLYKHKVVIGGKEYLGDTLTSIWSPIKLWISDPKVYEKHYSPEERLLAFNEENGRYCVPDKEQRKIKNKYGLRVNKVIWAVYILENLQHFEALLTESIKKVISMYHTKNNFMLVPEYFNTGAAGKYACCDFADLKLRAIKRYIETKKIDLLEELFSDIEETIYIAGKRIFDPKRTEKKKAETMKSTTVWLDEYASWDSFVDSNSISNYVDKDGEVIELWESHKPREIPNKKQLEQLFANLEKILQNE